MVYLAIEPRAAIEAIRLAIETGWIVLMGSDAITPEEQKRYSLSGVNLTRFSYPLANATSEIVADALETIEEHHPGEIVWVQHA